MLSPNNAFFDSRARTHLSPIFKSFINSNCINYCIFVDTPWTDADFQQSADRIYRIGQNKKVTIISLVTKDSYDERVLDILQNKRVLSSYLIDKENSGNLNIFNE